MAEVLYGYSTNCNVPWFSSSLYRKHIWAVLTKLTMFFCVGMNPQWINDNKVVLFGVTEVKCYLHISVCYKTLYKMHFVSAWKSLQRAHLGAETTVLERLFKYGVFAISQFQIFFITESVAHLILLTLKRNLLLLCHELYLWFLQRTDFSPQIQPVILKRLLHHYFFICTLQIQEHQKAGNSLTCHFQIFE